MILIDTEFAVSMMKRIDTEAYFLNCIVSSGATFFLNGSINHHNTSYRVSLTQNEWSIVVALNILEKWMFGLLLLTIQLLGPSSLRVILMGQNMRNWNNGVDMVPLLFRPQSVLISNRYRFSRMVLQLTIQKVSAIIQRKCSQVDG